MAGRLKQTQEKNGLNFMPKELNLDGYHDELLEALEATRGPQPRDIFFIGASTSTIAQPRLSCLRTSSTMSHFIWPPTIRIRHTASVLRGPRARPSAYL